jgi:hypothetical protein
VLLLARPPAETLRHSDDRQVRCYRSTFSDRMEMLAPRDPVAVYLDRHEGWFRRCAAPMEVAAIDSQAYALRLGRFGNFGFEVEPTIGLRLLPQQEGTYAIVTVPLADADPALQELYDVDFQATLNLEPQTRENGSNEATSVSWSLDLSVWIRLPKVITVLPEGLVQSSGDHLLRQIVRQISRKLTWKVQEDFHASHGLVCPPRKRAAF